MNSKRRRWLGLVVLGVVALALGVAISRRRKVEHPPAASSAAGATRASFMVAPDGSAVYRIPIAVPPGTQAMQPSLSLIYSSQAGDGMVGQGWMLDGLPAITRCDATILEDGFQGGVDYDANDRFCLSASGITDGRLVPATAQSTYFIPGTIYHTEKESWSNVVSSTTTCGSGPCSFTVTLRTGMVLGFGTLPTGQIAAVAATTSNPPPAGSIRTWLLTQMTDVNGNSLQVTYTLLPPTLAGSTIPSTGAAYPLRVDYTVRSATPAMPAMRSVQFFYTQRGDSSYTYQGGAVIQNAALLTTIQTCISTTTSTPVTGLTCSGSGLQFVKQYNLSYQSSQNPLTQQSRLASVQECDGNDSCFPATTAAWSNGPDGLTATPVPTTGISNNAGWVADFNGDGRTDLLSRQIPGGCPGNATAGLYLSNGQGFVLPGQCVVAPITRYQYQFVGDYNGDGYADLLLANINSGVIYFSTGSGIGSSGTQVSNIALYSQNFVGDVNGDGMADLVTSYASNGNIYLATGTGFAAAIPFNNVQISQGQTWLVDFSGDGRADLFSAGSSSGTLYLSTGNGFATGISVSGLNLYNNSTWVGDFNGDNLPDLLSAVGGTAYISYANGAGFQAATTVTGMLLQQGKTWIGDFNGDRLMDLYSAGSNSGTIYYAQRGGGFASASAPGQNLSSNATWLGDFNGDGAADLYAPVGGGGNDTIFLASQGGTVQSSDQAPNQVLALTDGIGGQTSITYLPLTDPAVYSRQTQPASEQLDVLLLANTFQYTPLSPVQAPLYPNQTVEDPLYVVSSYTLQNAPAQNVHTYSYVFNYFYAQSLINLLGRGWLGFATVTRADASLGATTTTTYRQDFPYNGRIATRAVCASSGGITPCQAQDGSPLTVSTSSYTCQDAQSFAACQVSNSQYDPSGTQLFQVLLGTRQDQDTTYGSTVETDYTYDNYANPTLISSLGDVQQTSHPIYVCQSFLNSTNPWRIGYLQYKKHSSSSGCPSGISQWNPASDLDLGQLEYDGNMNVTSELHWDNQNSIWLGAQYTYDGYGNQLSDTLLTGATPAPVPSLTFTTSYEATYNTFPQARTTPTPDPKNKLSQPLVTTFAYDARFGKRIGVQDPNGNITNSCVDTFGRDSATEGPPPEGVNPDANCLTAASYPYVAATFTGNTRTALLSQVSWTDDTSNATISHQTLRRNQWDSNTSWLKSSAYIDGLKRAYRMVTANDDNKPVYVDRLFQTPALVNKRSLPYLAGTAASWIVDSYDAEGRKIKETTPYQAPDGAISTSEVEWRYSIPNTVTETRVENVGPSYVVRSPFEYYDGKKKTIDTIVASDGDAKTTFDYDLFGSLTGSLSPKGAGQDRGVGNQARYDSLGRRISYWESDTGRIDYYYNSWGVLDHQVDQKKQRIDFGYDNLLRKTDQTMRDSTGNVVQRFAYDYDLTVTSGSFSNLRGELSGVTASNAGAAYLRYAFGYDAYRDQTARLVSFPQSSQSFLFSATFDPMRRQMSRSYPDSLQSVVTRRYSSSANNLLQVAYGNSGAPEPQPYLSYSNDTPYNLPQQLKYHNGNIERLTYDMTGKPLSRTLTTISGSILQSMVYGWDTVDNLISELDCNYQGNSGNPGCVAIGVSGTSQVDLGQQLGLTSNRLTQAVGPFGAGQAQTTLSFGYDQAGNLTQSGGVTYGYSGNQPISGSSGGSLVFQAIYDGDGNLCFKTLGSTSLQNCPAPSTAPPGVTSYIYSFDVNNRLTSVQKNNLTMESYLYDDRGRRVQKTEFASDGQTVVSITYYVDPEYEVTIPNGGSSQYTLYLSGLRPRAVALTEPAGGGAADGGVAGVAAAFLGKDLTNSTVLVTGPGGSPTSQITYQPYGTASSVIPAGSAPASTLFQSKELDTTGMYYFGARYLDPIVGHLASADGVPAGSTYAQDALNRYAFALDNPSLYEDPSGSTPYLIMVIIFQAIFDMVAPEAVPVEAQMDFMIREGLDEETVYQSMSVRARDYLREYQLPTGRARNMAGGAANRLRAAGLSSDLDPLGGRATVSVAITRDGIFGDVSGAGGTVQDLVTGARSEPDVLKAPDLTPGMKAREVYAQEQALAEPRAPGGGRPRDSFEAWQVENCAEFRVCNRVSWTGVGIDDIQEMHTVDLRSLQDAPRCRNCRLTTMGIDPDVVTSDHAFTR
jgi:RHS repeat-associated protein